MKPTRLLLTTLFASLLMGVLAVPASAQQNIEKLKQFKVSGVDLEIPPVPQTGKAADALKENLSRARSIASTTRGNNHGR